MTTMMMMMVMGGGGRHSTETHNYGTTGMKVAAKPEGETVSQYGENSH